MNAQDFAAFVSLCKQRRGWSKTELSRRLGCGINQINIWAMKGAPPYIDLACAALDRDIGAWSRRSAPPCAVSTSPEFSRAPHASRSRVNGDVSRSDAGQPPTRATDRLITSSSRFVVEPSPR